MVVELGTSRTTCRARAWGGQGWGCSGRGGERSERLGVLSPRGRWSREVLMGRGRRSRPSELMPGSSLEDTGVKEQLCHPTAPGWGLGCGYGVTYRKETREQVDEAAEVQGDEQLRGGLGSHRAPAPG